MTQGNRAAPALPFRTSSPSTFSVHFWYVWFFPLSLIRTRTHTQRIWITRLHNLLPAFCMLSYPVIRTVVHLVIANEVLVESFQLHIEYRTTWVETNQRHSSFSSSFSSSSSSSSSSSDRNHNGTDRSTSTFGKHRQKSMYSWCRFLSYLFPKDVSTAAQKIKDCVCRTSRTPRMSSK